jgi:hypothetical protein
LLPASRSDGEISSPLLEQLSRCLPLAEACGQAAAGRQALNAVHSSASGVEFAAQTAAVAARYHMVCGHAVKVWRSLIEYVFDRCA